MKRALVTAIVLLALGAGTVAFTLISVTPWSSPRGPEQPVKFNHKIHAGDLAMDCLYCHYSADKSPVANIPTVATCMGCHRISATDKPEVQKLTGYFERGEPIPWVQVYHLPDHVKFNHKRHVKAGVECQTCHGPVQEMPVVYRYSSLKMGWCLDCHREKRDDPKFPASMDCLTCHH